jgi:hypothetical protein
VVVALAGIVIAIGLLAGHDPSFMSQISASNSLKKVAPSPGCAKSSGSGFPPGTRLALPAPHDTLLPCVWVQRDGSFPLAIQRHP